mgnify:CR=1 FL=1
MPYINSAKRGTACVIPKDAGELNFAFTRAISYYLESQGLRYQTINDIVGALEGAKAEFQRRIVAPYEDGKKAENGDVYAQDLLGSPVG